MATWAMLLAGHVLGVALAAWALTMRGTTGTASRLATILALLVLGGCGAVMAAYGLRVVVALRRPQSGAAPPPGSAPLAFAWLLVLAAVGMAVIALVGWGTAGVLPAVAGEFVFVPLAMRTRQYAEDLAGELGQPPAAP